jgi:hypothetical protein
LGGVFQVIKDELVEKNLAERLWNLFEELLQVIIDGIANHGFVDILEFKSSVEYLYIKELFKQSFLNKQLQVLEKAC